MRLERTAFRLSVRLQNVLRRASRISRGDDMERLGLDASLPRGELVRRVRRRFRATSAGARR